MNEYVTLLKRSMPITLPPMYGSIHCYVIWHGLFHIMRPIAVNFFMIRSNRLLLQSQGT